jgi:hypothetical protein
MSSTPEHDQVAKQQTSDPHGVTRTPTAAVQPKAADLQKPTNRHDSSPKGHSRKPANGNHSASPKKAAVANAPDEAAHDSAHDGANRQAKPSQTSGAASKGTGAVADIRTADAHLVRVVRLSGELLQKAQTKSVPSQELVNVAETLMLPLSSATEHLKTAVFALRDGLDAKHSQEKKPWPEVKAEVAAQDGIGDLVEEVSRKVGRFLSNLDGAVQARPELGRFAQGDAGMVVSWLGHLRSNLGLEAMGHDRLVGLVELKVTQQVYDLKDKRPQDIMMTAATATSNAWLMSVQHFGGGIQTLIETIGPDEISASTPGFVKSIFEEGKKLILKGAEFVTGSNVAAKIGLKVIENMLAYQERLEKASIRADKNAFIKELRSMAAQYDKAGLEAGGVLDTPAVFDAMDEEFASLGTQNPEDAFKQGDHVVVGAQATYLKDLRSRASAALANVPDASTFSSRFLVQWINESHKERKTSALRSPFEDSTRIDGYVGVALTLDYSSGLGFTVGRPNAATVHCPNAKGVAAALKQTIPDFNVSKLDTNMHIDIHLSDRAHDAVPADWRERTWHVHLGPEKMSRDTDATRRKWTWVQEQAGQSVDDILMWINDLKG